MAIGWVIALSAVGTLVVMVIVLALAEWAGKRIVKTQVDSLKEETKRERAAVEGIRNEVTAALGEIRVAAATITGALSTIGSFEVERLKLAREVTELRTVVNTHETWITTFERERKMVAEMLSPPAPPIGPAPAELDPKRPKP